VFSENTDYGGSDVPKDAEKYDDWLTFLTKPKVPTSDAKNQITRKRRTTTQSSKANSKKSPLWLTSPAVKRL